MKYETKSLPLVTFGFVNCNRLYYLKSCVESFLLCTEDYKNKELIVVDNASIESGTERYLNSLEARGIKVYRQKKRDPSNEYARALNIIIENSNGEIICPLAADMQFVLSSGWLTEYVKFMMHHENNIGCISFDAQRKIRNERHYFSNPLGTEEYKFLAVRDKNPILGAANAMYSKKIIELMYPWEIKNQSHEGGQDSETKMLTKVNELIKKEQMKIFNIAPIIPPSVAIYNEDGDNARVRENRIYGRYEAPIDGIKYYKINSYETFIQEYGEEKKPLSMETIAKSNGWQLPIDNFGNWIKSPIDIKNATPDQWKIIE